MPNKPTRTTEIKTSPGRTVIDGRDLLPEWLEKGALNATYPNMDGTLRTVKPSGDTKQGVLNWQTDAQSGYLMHLTSGPNSTAGTSMLGLGTEAGGANALLISHKGSGEAMLIGLQPGAGRGIHMTSRNSNWPLWVDMLKGSGPVQFSAASGEAFADGVVTAGSPVLTSATANFTAADVGKVLNQVTSVPTSPQIGAIPTGTTIVSVESATSVTLSVNAVYGGTGLRFQVSGRVPAVSQVLFRIVDTDYTTVLQQFTRGGATFNTADVAATPVRVNAKTGQTADILSIYDGASVKTFSIAPNGGVVSNVLASFSNAAVLGAPTLIATTYSSHPSLVGVRSGAVTGDNFQARGGGTTPLSRFNKDGVFITKINAAPADADLSNGEMALWFDPTPGTGGFRVKGKATDGTVITKTL